MKLQIHFRPSLPVILLGCFAALLWAAAWPMGFVGRLILLPFEAFYSALFLLAAWGFWRIHILERWTEWNAAGRLLILAPHEDDCVISAGGIGAQNARLGGTTRIVYLAPKESPAVSATRAAEAHRAWQEAGLQGDALRHLELLPPLRSRDPHQLRLAAAALRALFDDFKPTTIIMPMFEGGHVHHDMVAALVGSIIRQDDTFEVFEAPEYSPYFSLLNTPHRLLALSTRWMFGLVSYCGPPDGIDGRPILNYRMTSSDRDCKRRMLAAFVSQNAPSLVATRSYCDRLVRFDLPATRSTPFNFNVSYLRFVLVVRRLIPAKLTDRLFPVQLGTVGREPLVTDWRREWGDENDRPTKAEAR